MLVFPGMIAQRAIEAGMVVPDDPDHEFDPNVYPHFFLYCNWQLCRAIHDPEEITINAGVIAKLTVEEVKTATVDYLLNKGCLM